MSFSFNIFSAGGGGMAGGGSGIMKYPTAAALPAVAADGDVAITLDTNNLYSYDTGVGAWVIIGGPGVAITVSDTASVNLTLTGNVLAADLNIGATTLPSNTIGISLLIQPTGSTGLYGYVSASGSNLASGTTNGFLSASNWSYFTDKLDRPDLFFWAGTTLYPTVQSAVNAAELLPEADSVTLSSGICVFMPSSFPAETVIIRKNVNLFGMAGWQSEVDKIVIKPFNATLCPQNLTITGVNTLTGTFVHNDDGAGGFNPYMGMWSIRFQDCLLFGMTAININSLEFQTTKIFGDFVAQNIANVGFINSSNDSIVSYLVDDSLAHKPIGLTVGFNGFYSDHSTYNGFSLQTGVSSTLQNLHVSFEDFYQDYTAGLSTQVWFMNSPIAQFTNNGTEFLFWQDRSEYMPGATLAWGATVPLFTNDALDLLANRPGSVSTTFPLFGTTAIFIPAANGTTGGYLTAADWNTFNNKQTAIKIGPFSYISFAQGFTLSAGGTFQLGWGDTTNPGAVGPTHQVWAGDKRTTGNLGTDQYLQLRGGSLLSIGSTTNSGFTLVFSGGQGGTFTTFYNNGLGILSFGIPGAYNFYRSVSNAGATLNLQDRIIEITTGATNQTLNIGYAAAGNTGAWFDVIKIDSGLGSVTVQSPDLINGVTNFTFSSQWEAHKAVCNGVGWRIIT